MKARIFSAFALSLCLAIPALAQYNYSYGSGRVVNQTTNGMPGPSSTYIGAGTMSRSAQGLPAQPMTGSPGLPSCNMGANVRTPGDNIYQPKAIPKVNNVPYFRQPQVMTQQQYAQQQGMHFYVPGQNSSRSGGSRYSQQGNSNSNYSTNYTSGTATYAEHGYDGQRRF